MANGEAWFRDLLELTGDVDRVEALLCDAYVELDLTAGLLALAMREIDRIQLYAHFVCTTPMLLEDQQAACAYIAEIMRRVTAAVDDLVESRRRLLSIVRWLLVARALALARSRARRLCPAVLLAAAAAALVVYAASGGSAAPGSRTAVRLSVLMLHFLFVRL